MGRKSTYDQKVADTICEKLSQGIPLAEICRGEGMPCVRTVSDWRLAHANFDAAIARARVEGFDAIAADCLRIADDGTGDKWIDDEGHERTNQDVVQRSKLRVETRLKLLAKWDPKRYGEKVVVAGDPEAPLSTGATPEVIGALAQMTPEQLRALASKRIEGE